MKSNKQKRREEKARQAAKLQATAMYLQEHKGWNWVWPGGDEHWDGELPRNCWFTGLKPRNPNSKSPSGDELLGTHPYCGPSASTVGGRESRRGYRSLTPAERAKRTRGASSGRVAG